MRFRYGISYGPTFRYWLGFLKESENWDRAKLEAYQLLPKSSDKKCHSALDAESSSLMLWIPAFAGMTKLLVLAKLPLDLGISMLYIGELYKGDK